MSRTYSRRWCFVCGRDISSAGLAWYNHCMKHVREGKMRKVNFTNKLYRDRIDFEIIKGIKIIPMPKNPAYRVTAKEYDNAMRRYYANLHEEAQ